MKYKNVEERAMWEMRFRANKPRSKQNYRMAHDVDRDQQVLEERIARYQSEGRRLNKRMRNYLRSKENAN